MKLVLLNLYPHVTTARYMLSSYLLKAYLNKYYIGGNNLSIEVLNFSDKSEVGVICDKIAHASPAVVGYSCYIWNIEKNITVIEQLKEKIKAVHILGGPEISLKRIQTLSEPTLGDYYVIGEGERKILKLLDYFEAKKNGRETDPLYGVAYWQGKELHYEEDRNTISNLDEIPSIYLSKGINNRLYALQQAFIETQRGCKYRCKYCVYAKLLPSVCYYSLPRVFDELDHLIVKKQIKALRFFDANFLSDLNRAKKIVKHLINLKKNQDVRLPWIYWEFNYHNMDVEFIKLVASLKYRTNIVNTDDIPPADCPQHYSDLLKDYTVVNCIGIQSFCKQALKAVSRPGISRKKIDAFMKTAGEHNIVMKLDLILGLPFETFDSYFEGLEFFLPYFRNTDHILNIHRLQILPGSELEDMCQEYEIAYSQNAPHTISSTQNLTEQELNYASKLTAVLFRVLNSPLRCHFFEAKECTEATFYEFVVNIFNEITASEKLQDIKLVKNKYVDDDYWNDEIFREIPSEWLMNLFKKYLLRIENA